MLVKQCDTLVTLKGYLPKNAVIMGRRKADKKTTVSNSTDGSAEKHNEGSLVVNSNDVRFVEGIGEAKASLFFMVGSSDFTSTDKISLLEKMGASLGLKLSDLFICHIQSQGTAVNEPSSQSQVEEWGKLGPRVVVMFGTHDFAKILSSDQECRRGMLVEQNGTQFILTHDLDTLLTQATAKKDTWADLKLAAKHLGIQIAQRVPQKAAPEGDLNV
jgi:hypothetical protein